MRNVTGAKVKVEKEREHMSERERERGWGEGVGGMKLGSSKQSFSDSLYVMSMGSNHDTSEKRRNKQLPRLLAGIEFKVFSK